MHRYSKAPSQNDQSRNRQMPAPCLLPRVAQCSRRRARRPGPPSCAHVGLRDQSATCPAHERSCAHRLWCARADERSPVSMGVETRWFAAVPAALLLRGPITSATHTLRPALVSGSHFGTLQTTPGRELTADEPSCDPRTWPGSGTFENLTRSPRGSQVARQTSSTSRRAATSPLVRQTRQVSRRSTRAPGPRIHVVRSVLRLYDPRCDVPLNEVKYATDRAAAAMSPPPAGRMR